MDNHTSPVADNREQGRFRQLGLAMARMGSGSLASADDRKRHTIAQSDSAPVTPEPDYNQTREYEKTTPCDSPTDVGRILPPSFEIKTSFHALMATATNAWIQSQTRSNTATVQDEPTDDDPPEIKASFHELMANATDAWIQSQTSSNSVTQDDEATDKVSDMDPPPTSGRHLSKKKFVKKSHHMDEDSDTIGDDSKLEDPSDDQSMNSMTPQAHEKDVDEDISTVLEDGTLPKVSSTASLESHADTIDSQTEHPVTEKQSNETTTTRITYPVSTNKEFETLDRVFVRDQHYSWIPARVLVYQSDSAFVAVDLPDSWYETTVLESEKPDEDMHPSLAGVPLSDLKQYIAKFGVPLKSLRKVLYKDYDNGDLPLQNDEEGKRDMADLVELSFPSILYNLKARYYQQKPYTRVGNIVIAMNPFSWIGELYDPKTRDLYSNKLIWEGKGSMQNI